MVVGLPAEDCFMKIWIRMAKRKIPERADSRIIYVKKLTELNC